MCDVGQANPTEVCTREFADSILVASNSDSGILDSLSPHDVRILLIRTSIIGRHGVESFNVDFPPLGIFIFDCFLLGAGASVDPSLDHLHSYHEGMAHVEICVALSPTDVGILLPFELSSHHPFISFHGLDSI